MSHFMSYDRFAELQHDHPPFVLQIGANDGILDDPINHILTNTGLNWHGLLVEPLADLYEKLKKTYASCNTPDERLKFANVAIVEKDDIGPDGMVEMERVADVETKVADGTVRPWAPGIPTLSGRARNPMKGMAAENKSYKRVNATTLSDLLAHHHVERIDVLQIDVEGHDYSIFKQLDFKKYHPSVVNLEIEHMPKDELQSTKELLTRNGYFFITTRDDLFAVDENIIAQMITPEETAHYQKYIDNGAIKDPAKLPYIVALLDEAAVHMSGVTEPAHSSSPVKKVFDDGYVQNFLKEKGKIKLHVVPQGMEAIERMRPYFKDDYCLSEFLENELPEIHREKPSQGRG